MYRAVLAYVAVTYPAGMKVSPMPQLVPTIVGI